MSPQPGSLRRDGARKRGELQVATIGRQALSSCLIAKDAVLGGRDLDLESVERLVTELIGSGRLGDDTTSDLYRFLAEARSNTLHIDDLEYVRSLHSRIAAAGYRTSSSDGTPKNGDARREPQSGKTGAPNPEVVHLRSKLLEAHGTIAELRRHLKNADRTAEFSELRDELARANKALAELRQGAPPSEAGESKFREIKKRFARKYHPNSVGSGSLEATLRAEIFKEFWTEIEAVERS